MRGLRTPSWDNRPRLSLLEESALDCEALLNRMCGASPTVRDYIDVLSIRGIPTEQWDAFIGMMCAARAARNTRNG